MAIIVKSMQKNKKIIIGALCCLFLLLFFFVSKFNSSFVGPVQAEDDIAFTSEPLQFWDITVRLIKSSHTKNKHVFYFDVENAHDSTISTRSLYFKIKSNGNMYSSKRVQLDDTKLNPGMSTIAKVTFVMKHDKLIEGDPFMVVQRGLFFGEKHEFDLKE